MNRTRFCSAFECETPSKAHGLCQRHYFAARADGTTDQFRIGRLERVLVRTELAAGPLPTKCWLFTGAKDKDGYGIAGDHERAHRLVFAEMVGPIAAGLQIDHLCFVKACVNPQHLEAVSGKTNLSRADVEYSIRGAVTHCPKGHPYDSENTYLARRVGGFSRACRECSRARTRAWRAEKRLLNIKYWKKEA